MLEKLNRLDSEHDIVNEIKCHMDYATLESEYKDAQSQIQKYKEQLSAIKEILEKGI